MNKLSCQINLFLADKKQWMWVITQCQYFSFTRVYNKTKTSLYQFSPNLPKKLYFYKLTQKSLHEEDHNDKSGQHNDILPFAYNTECLQRE